MFFSTEILHLLRRFSSIGDCFVDLLEGQGPSKYSLLLKIEFSFSST